MNEDETKKLRAELVEMVEQIAERDPDQLGVQAALKAAILLDLRLEQIFNKIGTLDVRLK